MTKTSGLSLLVIQFSDKLLHGSRTDGTREFCGIVEMYEEILGNIYLPANPSSCQIRRYLHGNPKINDRDVLLELAN